MYQYSFEIKIRIFLQTMIAYIVNFLEKNLDDSVRNSCISLFEDMLSLGSFQSHFLMRPILSLLFLTKPSGPRIVYCCFVSYILLCEIKAVFLSGNFTKADKQTSTASTSKETNTVLISCYDPKQLQQSTCISFMA